MAKTELRERIREIVDHHDLIRLQGRSEAAFDVGQGYLLPVIAPSIGPHAILAESGHEGDRLPMTLWL
jgi:hypothetical protein